MQLLPKNMERKLKRGKKTKEQNLKYEKDVRIANFNS